MAHDPRIFVGTQQAPGNSGHQLHTYSANSPALAAFLSQVQNGTREFTTAEYAAWDAGNKTFNTVESHGGK